MGRSLKIFYISIAVLFLAAAGLLYRLNTSAVAEGEIIGYIDSDAVLESYGPAKDVNAELDSLRSRSETELRKKVTERFGPGDVSALPEESQMEIHRMVEEADARYRQEMTRLRDEKWEPIVKKINEVIKLVGQEHKVVVVLDKAAVVSGGVDLTDEVVKRLTAQ